MWKYSRQAADHQRIFFKKLNLLLEAQFCQCFVREFSHVKVTLLLLSRRDRYRTYELSDTNMVNIAFIFLTSQFSFHLLLLVATYYPGF